MLALQLAGGLYQLLTATVQNLKRLAMHATRPPPQPLTA